MLLICVSRFTDVKARAILLWDSPSIEFVKDDLLLVCMDFELPSDPLWWRKMKQYFLPFKNKKFGDATVAELTLGLREFFDPESAALLSNVDRLFNQEIKELGWGLWLRG